MSLEKSQLPDALPLEDKAIFSDRANSYFVGVHVTDKYSGKEFECIVLALCEFAKTHPNVFFLLLSDGKSRRGRELKQDVDAGYIASKLPKGRAIKVPYRGHWEFVSLLDRLDMIFTSKLHVGIVSSTLGKNVVAVPYHSKTVRFYNQIGNGDRCLNHDVTAASVLALLNKYIYCDGVEIPANVVNDARKNFCELERCLSLVCN